MSTSEEQLLTGSYDNYETTENPSLDTIDQRNESNFKSELSYTVKSSVPLIISFFLQYVLSVTTVFAAAKLGARELAAASLAVCTFNLTGLAVYQGMSTSLDSFCSQAYGSGDFHNVGIYFQRCTLMMFVVTIFPLSFIWWFSADILSPMIGDRELAELAQLYLRIMTLGTPGLFLFESGKRFLQAQHIFQAATNILLVVAPLNFLLNYYLVWHPIYGLGFIGAPIACVIVYWTISILMLLYVVFFDGKKCWDGLNWRKAVVNWSPMLRLALPGVIMVEAEYFAFEVLTILAASFGTNSLAAQSIASNVGSLVFQLSFAVAVVLTTRIGHLVGMKNIKGAQILLRIFLILGIFLALFNFLLVFLGRHSLVSVFSQDPEVVKIANKLIILVSLNQFADAFNVLGAGVLRGQGKQRIGSVLNLISYYVIALPIGYIMAFYFKYGVSGLWVGLIFGVAFLALTEGIVIYNSDWNLIIEESHNRHDH